MPTKWTPGHYAIVAIGAAMAVLTYLSSDPVLGVYAKPALAILTVLLGYLGLTTGKATNGVGGPKAPAAILMLFVGGTWIAACQVAAPAANLGQCILADVAKSDSIAQIALDCGADIPSVLIAILESVDPGVLASKAYAEAVQIQAAAIKEAARK